MVRRILFLCTQPQTARAFLDPFADYVRARGEVVMIYSPWLDPLKASRVHPFHDLLRGWWCWCLIRRFKPDIVHTSTAKAGALGRVAAWMAGVPLILHTAHAWPFHAYVPWWKQRLYRWMERQLATITDCIIVDTLAVQAEGVAAGMDLAKLVQIYPGVNLKKFTPQPNTSPVPIVGTVARLVEEKGLEVFLEMAALIHKDQPEVRFMIVGEGPLRSSLENYAARLGLHEIIDFLGHRSDIPALLAQMRVFVLPTKREGFGMAVAEAMAMAIPVVVSDIPPLREVVEYNVTGLLASRDDSLAFAGYVLALLAQAPLRERMGVAGRRRVMQLFDEPQMFHEIEAQYQRGRA